MSDIVQRLRAVQNRGLVSEDFSLIIEAAAEIERLLPISERPSYEEYFDTLNWRGLVTLELTGPEPLEISVGRALKLIRQFKTLWSSSLAMALGWCHADDCVDLDEGRDPREKEIPDMMARAMTDLAICNKVVRESTP